MYADLIVIERNELKEMFELITNISDCIELIKAIASEHRD